MSDDHNTAPAKLDKEQLTRKYGANVASKLSSLDADICRLYKQTVDCVGQDPSRLSQLAEPLCQYIAQTQRRRQHRRSKQLILAFVAVLLLLSCLIACETSRWFICAIARILWIKVDYLPCVH